MILDLIAGVEKTVVFKRLRENKLEPKIRPTTPTVFQQWGHYNNISDLKDFDSLLLKELIQRYATVGRKNEPRR